MRASWIPRRLTIPGIAGLAAIIGWILLARTGGIATDSDGARTEEKAPAPSPASLPPTLAARGSGEIPSEMPDAEVRPSEEGVTRELPLDVAIVDASDGRVPASELQRISTIARITGDSHAKVATSFSVDIPAGYATWEEPKVVATVARRAVRLVHVFPLRREAAAYLTVRDAEGRPVNGTFVRARVGGRATDARWDAGNPAGRLSGLPFLPGERVEFVATQVADGVTDSEYRVRSAQWHGRFESDSRSPLHAEVTLPDEWTERSTLIGLGGGDGFPFRGRGNPRPQPVGRVEVTVFGRDGRPLAETDVRIGWMVQTTDSKGFAAFDRVDLGDREVATDEPGVVTATALVAVTENGTARVTLRESEGGTVGVEVVDEKGVGLPFATLQLGKPGGVTWCDLSDDGVQRTDLYTDALGRRILAHVSRGRLGISAAFGERQGDLVVDVREGERTSVRIVVK
jgi:hypothetical protein